MQQKTLFFLLSFSSFLSAFQEDYRPALKAAALAEDERRVKEILDTLPEGTIPTVIPKSDNFVDTWTSSPIFLDTNPRILEILHNTGVPVTEFSQLRTYTHYPVEEHNRYENVAWLLSKGSPYSPWHSLRYSLDTIKNN